MTGVTTSCGTRVPTDSSPDPEDHLSMGQRTPGPSHGEVSDVGAKKAW